MTLMTPTTALGHETMARFGKILLATDLTSASSSATEEAVELAVRLDARLLVMSVLETGKGGMPRRGVRPEVRDARSREVQAVVGQARAAGADASFLVWEGEAGEAITAAAEAEQVDLIVVGSHGRSTVGRFLLGSVSDHVVHHATCPVLVVRAPEELPTPAS